MFGVVGVSLIAGLGGVGGTLSGGFITLLAILFAVQASRIRFVFDSDCFELKQGDDLKDSGENFVVGGANRWAYTSFVNWDFFPSLAFPILVYFKETQTPKTDGSEPGQIHFFPAGMYILCIIERIVSKRFIQYFLSLYNDYSCKLQTAC